LLLVPALTAVAAPAQQRATKECSMCHLRWVADFESEQKKDYLLEFTEEKVVATEMMCYSCHDGSIVDSRLRVWETSRHKAGTKPSAAISVPETFPLDKAGQLTCATCHSAHGVDSTTDMGSTIFLREPNINSSMCRKCHQDKDDGPSHGKHPINVAFEAFPEKILNSGGKAGAGADGKKNLVICESCHTPHGSTNNHFLVIPNSKAGLTHAMLCETCHGVSPDLKSDDALRRYSHPVAVDILEEAELPEKWDNGEKPYLGDGKAVNCRTCHSPHNGTKDNHLLVSSNEKGRLCLTCHTSKKKIFGTKHDLASHFPQEKNAYGMTAAETGACFACHSMHKGQGPKMWARPTDGESIDALCGSCHQKGRLAEKALTGKQTHPINIKPSAGMQTGPLPLFAANGQKSPEGVVTCASCHDLHTWSVLSDDRGGKEVQGDGNNSFLRKPLAPDSSLCRTCHTDKAPILETKHDMNLMFPKSRNAKAQTVQEVGVCGACHLPHNALGNKLWALQTRESENALEGLCLSCHAKGGMAEEKTTGSLTHPIGASPILQEQYQDKLPLFGENGKRDPEGTVSCPTCHDVHRWEAGKDIGPGTREREGDRFSSFLRVPYDDTAKLCSACHEENALVVGTDHDLRITAPKSLNLNQEDADTSGVCSACHLVHNAWGNRLWARGVGPGGNRNEALCTGCHARRKEASRKTVGEPNHPMNKRVADARPTLRRETRRLYRRAKEAGERLDTELPLFVDGGDRSVDGNITCPTCHNVHRWNPDKMAAGPGEKTEGDASNSFLRKSNAPEPSLCITCHATKGYVVGTDHDMALTAPEAENKLKQTVAASGVCSACHVPHGSRGDGYLLWAREQGEGSEFRQEQVCLSCHSSKGVGSKKIVEYFSHPKEVRVPQLNRPGAQFYAPVYNQDGKKANVGLINCPTCHNPHEWVAEKPERGPGKLVEGNNRNSFLRFKSSHSICRNCHGLDSLNRYKYFHSNHIRKNQQAEPPTPPPVERLQPVSAAPGELPEQTAGDGAVGPK
jgi:predicted CXXCH cytochrome family protein